MNNKPNTDKERFDKTHDRRYISPYLYIGKGNKSFSVQDDKKVKVEITIDED